jgi:hypothetical protein
MDGETDSSNSEADNSRDEDTKEVQTYDLIGNDEYLLRVRHILNARTHVVVVVAESEHVDLVVGSERILTIVQAQALYVAYNAM